MATNQYNNSDHAGTSETFKKFVIGGARGGGGSNFTGSYSATGAVSPTDPPIGETASSSARWAALNPGAESLSGQASALARSWAEFVASRSPVSYFGVFSSRQVSDSPFGSDDGVWTGKRSSKTGLPTKTRRV